MGKTTRTRYSDESTVTGRMTRKLTGSTSRNGSLQMSLSTCIDVVPAQPDQNLTITHLRTTGGIMTGEGKTCRIDTPIPVPSLGPTGNYISHLSVPGNPDDVLSATKVAADTNPSEPIVAFGTSLAELREIPNLLRKRGVDLYNSFNYRNRSGRRAVLLATGAIADLNLRFQFGMKPILGDIDALLFIRKSLNNKIRDVLKVERKGGLIRKRIVFDLEAVETDYGPEVLLFSAWGTANYMKARFKRRTRVTKWVVCRWVPDGTRKLPAHKDKRFQRGFTSKVLGLEIFNFNSIWQALPWSWLVDWVFNVGDYVAATNNTMNIKLASVVVCTTSVTVQEVIFTQLPSGIKAEKMVRTLTTKTRKTVSLDIQPKMRFLTASQVGILASIARSR